MRLWSLHPKHLDTKGLVALWREGLLAQAVLLSNTKGYKNHPQLNRFKNCTDPVGALGFYLKIVADHAASRGYKFNTDKIHKIVDTPCLFVTDKQIDYEAKHLKNKLAVRSPGCVLTSIEVHPLFTIVPGDIEEWEVISDNIRQSV